MRAYLTCAIALALGCGGGDDAHVVLDASIDARHDAGPDAVVRVDAAPLADARPLCGQTLVTDPEFIDRLAVTPQHIYWEEHAVGAKQLVVKRVHRTLRTVENLGTIAMTTDFTPIVVDFVADSAGAYLGLDTGDFDDPTRVVNGIWQIGGPGVAPVRVTADIPDAIALDASHLYWTTDKPTGSAQFDPSVRRRPRAGGDAQTLVSDLEIFPRLAVTGSDIFYTDSLALYRKPKAGGDPVFMDNVSPGGTVPLLYRLVADGDRLVWFTNFDATFWTATAAAPKRVKLLREDGASGRSLVAGGGDVYWEQSDGVYRLAPQATVGVKIFNPIGTFAVDGDTLVVASSLSWIRAVPLGTCTE